MFEDFKKRTQIIIVLISRELDQLPDINNNNLKLFEKLD